MPRIARGALDRGFFHVLNRGNHRRTLFADALEFAAFLELLALATEKCGVRLWAYCLMSNHWHMVAEVDGMAQLSRWVHWFSNRHVRTVHRAHGELGGRMTAIRFEPCADWLHPLRAGFATTA